MASSAALAGPIQSYCGQANCASKVRPTTEPPFCISGRQAMVSDFSEYAETCMAVATDSNGVFRKLPPSASCGREADGVHDAVEAAELLADDVGQGGQVLVVGDVELDDLGGLGQLLGDALGQRGPRERGEDDLGALLLGQLGGVEGDGGLGQHTGDQDALAVEDSAHGDQ